MSDSLCKCFTGRITRLINCLNLLDPLVKIDLMSENEMINMICQQVYESLEEEEEEINGKGQRQETEEEPVATILTAENYRRQVEEELEKRGIIVTDEIRERHIDPIADLC